MGESSPNRVVIDSMMPDITTRSGAIFPLEYHTIFFIVSTFFHVGDYWARTCAGSRCQRTEVSTHVVGRAQVPEQARSCGQGERMRAADADDYCLSGVAVAGTTQPTAGDGRRSSSRDSDTGSGMVVPTLASRDAHPLLSAYT